MLQIVVFQTPLETTDMSFNTLKTMFIKIYCTWNLKSPPKFWAELLVVDSIVLIKRQQLTILIFVWSCKSNQRLIFLKEEVVAMQRRDEPHTIRNISMIDQEGENDYSKLISFDLQYFNDSDFSIT